MCPEALVIGRISAEHRVALMMLRERRMLANIDDLRSRAKAFALDIINLVKGLPRHIATDAIARQLIRAGTGVCANRRAAGRARSRREFIAKLASLWKRPTRLNYGSRLC
jgi:23S rRNA-intervening sequence protein